MAAGNYLYHCVAVRYRVTGAGIFYSRLFSLDDINTQELTSFALASTSERYPNLLANFIEQRMNVEFEVNELNDQFTLRQIQFYLKPVATGYPQ